MKRNILTISFLLLALMIASTSYAEVRYSEFDARSENGRVVITWKTSQELGCSIFKVERSVDGVNYFEIASFAPHGTSREYQHIDADLFKQSSRTFHYRVKAESITGYDTTESKSVNVVISGIQQTWGSLKAMFK